MWPPRQERFFLNRDTTLHKKKMSRVVTRFLFLRAYRWSRKNTVASKKHFHKFDIHVLLWEIESLFLRPAVASKKKKTAKSGIGDTRYWWKYENVSSEAISFTLALLQEISNYCYRRSIWKWMRCKTNWIHVLEGKFCVSFLMKLVHFNEKVHICFHSLDRFFFQKRIKANSS